jgi:thioredoxin 1
MMTFSRNFCDAKIKLQKEKDKEDCKMSAININKNNFENELLNSDKTVLLDFWASWCAPCRRVVPIVEEIADERRDIKVGKINVDEEPELANKFSIMSIPTLVVMKNGKIVQQVSGARPKNVILEML